MPITPIETDFGPGAEGAGAAQVPGVPAFESHGSGTITISFTTGDNDEVCTYSIRVKHDTGGGYAVKGYVQADGTVDASEVFQDAATWGATIEVSGLTDFIPYTFAASAKNELGVQTAYSSESAVMNTLPDIDYGLESDNLEREVTGGNVKVDTDTGLEISGDTVTEAATTQYYGTVTITYTLVSYESDVASIDVEFSEDGGSTWATATDAGTGDGKTGLASSPTGVEHTFDWDSYTDAGLSEYQTDVKVRIRAKDAEDDPGAYVESDEFTVNNRPGKITWVNADSRDWDEDTTPVFQAVIPYLRGGTKGYPELSVYDSTGTVLIAEFKSVESIAGWEYETEPATWVAMAVTGIPDTAIDGVNRMRFTVPAGDALAVGEYLITGRMGETRDLG